MVDRLWPGAGAVGRIRPVAQPAGGTTSSNGKLTMGLDIDRGTSPPRKSPST